MDEINTFQDVIAVASETKHEFINRLDNVTAFIILADKYDSIKAQVSMSVEGSNVRRKLCTKYGVNPDSRYQYSELIHAMMQSWLSERYENDIIKK